MTIYTNAGTRLFVRNPDWVSGSVSPRWFNVAEIMNFGEFGRVYEQILVQTVENRNVRKRKGMRNDGDLVLQLHRDTDSYGQVLCKRALDEDIDHRFKIVLSDYRYDSDGLRVFSRITFLALVMAFPTNIGGPNSVIGGSITLAIQSNTLREFTPALSAGQLRTTVPQEEAEAETDVTESPVVYDAELSDV